MAEGYLRKFGQEEIEVYSAGIETRLRHMSNASLKVPNKGINNVIFLVVIGKII